MNGLRRVSFPKVVKLPRSTAPLYLRRKALLAGFASCEYAVICRVRNAKKRRPVRAERKSQSRAKKLRLRKISLDLHSGFCTIIDVILVVIP